MTALKVTIRTTSSMLNKRTILVVSEADTGEMKIPMGRWMFDTTDVLHRKALTGTIEERIEQVRLLQQGVAEESLRRVLTNVANKKKEA